MAIGLCQSSPRQMQPTVAVSMLDRNTMGCCMCRCAASIASVTYDSCCLGPTFVCATYSPSCPCCSNPLSWHCGLSPHVVLAADPAADPVRCCDTVQPPCHAVPDPPELLRRSALYPSLSTMCSEETGEAPSWALMLCSADAFCRQKSQTAQALLYRSAPLFITLA